MSTNPSPAPAAFDVKSLWPLLAFLVSVVGVVGSLYLSLGLDLKACPLCFYQRAFMMAVATVLGIGFVLPGLPRAVLAPLALAPASAGAGIAGFHAYLVVTEVLECPAGVLGTLPFESLAIYAVLVVLLLVDLFHQGRYIMQGIGAVLLGAVFCSTCVKATPPAPTPTAPYQTPLDGCRKAFHEKK